MITLKTLLTAITEAEGELVLVESIIKNVLIFGLPEGLLVANLTFSDGKQYDYELIGGLAATIQEFTGDINEEYIKSINMDDINLLFVTHDKFIILFVVDPNYPDTQFRSALLSFRLGFIACYNNQDYGKNMDGAAIAAQTMVNLISDELDVDITTGSKVTIYPFRLRELAEKTARELLGSHIIANKDLFDEQSSPQVSQDEVVKQQLHALIDGIENISQLTLITTDVEGNLLTHTVSSLDQQIQDNLYETVMGMIDIVSTILDLEKKDREIDLDDRIILFEKVNDFSFIFLVIEDKSSMDATWTKVEQISADISASIMLE